MKKAKEAATEVIALFPLTDSALPDSQASREAALAAAVAYRQELMDNLVARRDTSRGAYAQGSLVRDLHAAWKGFVHRVSHPEFVGRAPDEFFTPPFNGSFEVLARGVIPKDIAGLVWDPPVSPKARAAAEKAEADAKKAAKKRPADSKKSGNGGPRGKPPGKRAGGPNARPVDIKVVGVKTHTPVAPVATTG